MVGLAGTVASCLILGGKLYDLFLSSKMLTSVCLGEVLLVRVKAIHIHTCLPLTYQSILRGAQSSLSSFDIYFTYPQS